MATLISQGDNNTQRRCDAKCYDAKSPDCDCCCKGLNHGVGLKQAQSNTAELVNQILKDNNLVINLPLL
jgi:hypothetical protein